MKSIKQVLWLFALCTNMLFFSKNANAQCSSFNVTASKTADGSSLGDVTVTASIAGGSASTSFTWYTSGYSYVGFGATKANLSAGSYCVIARDSSSSPMCKDTFCLTVTDTGTFNCVNMTSGIFETDLCLLNDIKITAYGYGGSGNYLYKWNTGILDTSKQLLNKTTGTYSVTITDGIHGCKDTLNITVIDDTCNICDSFQNNGYISENDPCLKNDITLNIVKWGGSNRYFYLWNTGSTASSLYNRGGGSYWVKITDSASGCKDTLYITVTDDTCSPCQYFNAFIDENDPCQKSDITLTAYPQDTIGTIRYKYLWNTGATSKSLSNRGAGTYWVKVTDSILGCVDTAYITVADDTCNPCSNHIAYIYEEDLCAKNDITLRAYPNRWIGRYKFLWNTGSTDTALYNRSNGNYWVRVSDSITGCIDTAFITVVDDTCGVCDSFINNGYIYENDPCLKNDIALTAYKWAGSSKFKYLWNTGATTQSILNKGGGSYSVKITDSVYGCKDTLFITVIDDTCSPCQYFNASIYENDSCQKNDISLAAYPQDSLGTIRYKYLWNTGSTSKTLTNKGAGSYWVIVTDSILGCVDTAYITVTDDTCNPCDNFYAYLYNHDSCKSNDIKIYAYAYGGSGNYSYNWNTGSTASTLTNRGTGWYKVTITDVTNGCIYKDSIYAIDSNFRCCQAYFYTNDSAVASTKTFYGYSNVIDSSGGSTTTYTWNFGDGNTGTGQTKNHSYTSSGNKTVCLYISTASGCKDTFCSVVNSPAPGKNLKVSHYGIPYIRDTHRYTYITYQNIGTTTENGIVEYKYPVGMTLIYSNISVLTHIGNKITFSVGSLAPGASGTIYIEMKIPSSFVLGTVKCDTAIILPISGDIASSNNTSYECDSVVGSWDPNDKTPNPKGIGPEGAISPETKEIGYLIRFENEGNWRTYRVRVEDEIDPSFDINSIMIGDVSHAYRLVRNGSKMIWYFDNIELTPKSKDPNRSHGYIQYTLQLRSGLALGTQLKNTAYIYFDGNPAIITNTTKNTLKNADGSSSVRDLTSDDLLDFDLKRIGDKLIINSPSKMQSIRIYDVSGKLLVAETVKSNKHEINNVPLNQGVYIVHVDIDEQTVIKKIGF